MDIPPPPPPELPPFSPVAATFSGTPTKDEKNFAMFAHVGAILTSFIAPLVIYLMKKDESPFIAMHSRKALVVSSAFCVLMFVLAVLGVCLSIILIGFIFFILMIPLYIAYIIFCIYEAVQASNGKDGIRIPF